MLWFTLKVEKILKGRLNLISSPSPSLKLQIMGRNVCLGCKGTLLGAANKLLKIKSLLNMPAMSCLYTSSKLSCPYFEFSLNVKVMGSNVSYLLRSFYFINLIVCLFVCKRGDTVLRHGGPHTNLDQCNQGS